MWELPSVSTVDWIHCPGAGKRTQRWDGRIWSACISATSVHFSSHALRQCESIVWFHPPPPAPHHHHPSQRLQICQMQTDRIPEAGYRQSHGLYVNVQRPGHTVHPHNWNCIWGGKWLALFIALETAGGVGGGSSTAVWWCYQKKGSVQDRPLPVCCPYTEMHTGMETSVLYAEGTKKITPPPLKRVTQNSFCTIKRLILVCKRK